MVQNHDQIKNFQNRVQQSPKQPKSPNGNMKIKIIVTVVILAVVVAFFLTKDKCSTEQFKPTSTETIDTSEVDSSESLADSEPESETATVEVSNPDALTEITISNVKEITKGPKGFTFADDLQYPGVTALSDSCKIYLSDDGITVRPIKSCAYHAESNRIDITHTSGAVLSIARASFREPDEWSLDQLDKQLKKNITTCGATELTFGYAFIGSGKCGRYVKGNVEISGKTYTMLLSYIDIDDCMYTVTSLYKEEDYFTLMLKSVTYGNSALQLG